MEINEHEFEKALQDAENRGYIKGAAEMGHRYSVSIASLRLIIQELTKKLDDHAREMMQLIQGDIERIKAGRVEG